MKTSTLSNGTQLNSRRWIGKTLTGLMLALLFSLGLAQPARAATTITVTSTNDDSSAGTLRDALASAADGDTIDATGVSGTILLTSGELVVSNNLTIVGPGPGSLAVDGNAASGVFAIYPGLTVIITGLTITNGANPIVGGGIHNDRSSLTLSNCTISGNAAVLGGGIFNDGQGGSATLHILASTIAGNSADGIPGFAPGIGGGVYNFGVSGTALVEIRGSVITGNSAVDTGGGLYNDGDDGSPSLNVFASTLSDNFAREGGGIGNAHATLIVSNSVLTGNVATNGNGGAILNYGQFPGSATATIIGSSITSNSAPRANGGGVYNDGSGSAGSAALTVVASTISSNQARYGGGLFNAGDDNGNATMTMIASTVRNNSANFSGGGIANQTDNGSVTLTLSNCTLAANNGFSNAGGILNTANNRGTATVTVMASTISSNGISGIFGIEVDSGGGIYNSAGNLSLASVTVNTSTLYGNGADNTGGGIYNQGSEFGNAKLMVISTTFSGNSAGRGGGIYNQGDWDADGGAFGGPIAITSGVAVVLNCTFNENVAGSASGGAIQNYLGWVEVGSSIFQYGDSGQNLYNASVGTPCAVVSFLSCAGYIKSLSHNVSNDSGDFNLSGGDQINTDPMLGPLQDNGGPTFTHALLPGSPAIDYGTNFLAVTTDQRGFARTVDNPAITNWIGGFGNGTDSGAFELQNFAPAVICSNVTVVAGAGCAANASIDAGTYDPDAGDTFTLSQSPAGPYPVGQTLVTLTAVDNHGTSNSCQSTVTVTPVADVGIAKAVVNGQGKPGQALIYTLTVRNFGPCSASGVSVADVVPAGTTFVSASPTPASAPPAGSVGTVTWNLGTMSSGGQTNLTLTVKVSTKGNPQIVNTATVTSTSSDPNAANNSATVTTTRKAK